MDMIIDFLGVYTPQLVNAPNTQIWYTFPDMLWIFKALLLLIIALYTVKSIYSILRVF